jgi:hypothetical protein
MNQSELLHYKNLLLAKAARTLYQQELRGFDSRWR